ncbi:MAG: hypothetical protein WCK57_10410 [Verrucomicrobiae bacterium]
MNTKQLACFLLLFLGVSICSHAEDQLLNRLRLFTSQVQAGKMEFTNAEAGYLEISKDCSTLEEKGQVYLAIVNTVGFFKRPRPDKIAEYCEQALKYPQSILGTCRIYSVWGGSLKEQNRGVINGTGKNNTGKISEVRRLITKPWLQCLAIIQTNHVPEKRQSPPSVGGLVINGPKTDVNYQTTYQAAIKRHDEQWNARQRVDFENELVDCRDSVINAMRQLYSLPPEDWEGLKAEALETMHDANAVDALIEKVKQPVTTNH